VNCIVGQGNDAHLILRGSSFTRNVRCYPNVPPAYMSILSPAPMALTASSLNELTLSIRPTEATTRECILNVVDADSRSLVSSWMVVCHCSTPTVTKSFDLSIGRGLTVSKVRCPLWLRFMLLVVCMKEEGAAHPMVACIHAPPPSHTQRISYTNPYSNKRQFRLTTNRPDVVQFKESLIRLGAADTTFIGLRFSPTPVSAPVSAPAAEVLIFLTDEADKIEGCLCIHIKYI
jgi:hypothetical protein